MLLLEPKNQCARRGPCARFTFMAEMVGRQSTCRGVVARDEANSCRLTAHGMDFCGVESAESSQCMQLGECQHIPA